MLLRVEGWSPELEVYRDIFPEAVVAYPWSTKSYIHHDVAICIGPVRKRPNASKLILVTLGETKNHFDLNWDAIIVSSQRAHINASKRFGLSPVIVVAYPPLWGLQYGRRRLMSNQSDVALRMVSNERDDGIAWGIPSCTCQGRMNPLKLLDYNAQCRYGAIGEYDCLEDGYDIPARRHLHFGSPFVCDMDKLVLGDLTEYCFKNRVDIENPCQVVSDLITIEDYKKQIWSVL